MKKYKFYKDPDNRWYVDLPDWTGTKAELEMVAGADSMLEYMAEGTNEVNTYLSEEHFEGADKLEFIRETPEVGDGSLYIFKTHRGIEINLEVWLCSVTMWVFGNKYPKIIYIQSA